MPREYIVIAHPAGNHFDQVTDAVHAVNGLQSYFRCKLVKDRTVLRSDCIEVNPTELSKAIKQKYKNALVIALTEEYYSSRYIVEEKLPKHILVTCADWDDGDQPPLRLFLIYSLASALLTLEARLSEEQNKEMSHEHPVGCIFDWWDNSRILLLDFVAARLCGKCQSNLAAHLTDKDQSFHAIQSILDFVRRAVMGNAAALPSKIWIVHGKSKDWQILKLMLRTWGLQVDEFNEIEVVGTPITERWRQMANHARFAFALLTEDDHTTDGRKLPRLNVAHEIGLCHARLGLEGTFVLREGNAEVFGNLQGINYLQYESGKLSEKKEDIKKLLKERGVL